MDFTNNLKDVEEIYKRAIMNDQLTTALKSKEILLKNEEISKQNLVASLKLLTNKDLDEIILALENEIKTYD